MANLIPNPQSLIPNPMSLVIDGYNLLHVAGILGRARGRAACSGRGWRC